MRPVILVSIASLAWQGLNLGIDFKGGSQIAFQTNVPVSVERVRSEAAAVIPADAVVQGRGNETAGRYTSFQIRTESLSPAEQEDLQQTLTNSLNVDSYSIQNVSGSFSSQILRGALLAIVVSLALIVIYISIRFQWKFAVPVLIALLHDIVITLGIYSLTQREMTTSTIAALLTILGYSIYDTIIIFDRIRENIPLMRRSSFAMIANQSLWETVRRSLATTFITLLPVLSLLIFGGDTLKDFAFALLVGIASGAYSTIFIATPILTMIKEREPEFAARKGEDVVDEKPLDVEVEPEPAPVAAAAATLPAASRRLSRRERRRLAATRDAGNGAGPADELAGGVEPDAIEADSPVAEPEDEPVVAGADGHGAGGGGGGEDRGRGRRRGGGCPGRRRAATRRRGRSPRGTPATASNEAAWTSTLSRPSPPATKLRPPRRPRARARAHGISSSSCCSPGSAPSR